MFDIYVIELDDRFLVCNEEGSILFDILHSDVEAHQELLKEAA